MPFRAQAPEVSCAARPRSVAHSTPAGLSAAAMWVGAGRPVLAPAGGAVGKQAPHRPHGRQGSVLGVGREKQASQSRKLCARWALRAQPHQPVRQRLTDPGPLQWALRKHGRPAALSLGEEGAELWFCSCQEPAPGLRSPAGGGSGRCTQPWAGGTPRLTKEPHYCAPARTRGEVRRSWRHVPKGCGALPWLRRRWLCSPGSHSRGRAQLRQRQPNDPRLPKG